MSMVGTFDGFTAARLGLYAAQHGLRVTGNNVANINTIGYTRQRVDQMSFKSGANDMYRSFYDNHVGSGALVTGINQIRDPYLDIRYRNASTDTYHYDTWLAGLQNIASILDEVGKGDNKDGLIYRQLQDLAEKLRTYSANPTDLNERLVRNSAESLTGLFHNAATQLEKLYNETEIEFGENISAVNEILTNIRDLNKSIRESEIHGDHALEMRDERNRQIDALSQYLDIKVEYSYEDIGAGVQVEKLTIRLNNANPDNSVHTDESILVDGVFATKLSVPEEKPVLNTYEDPYLQGYTYLKKISAKDTETAQELLDALSDKKGLVGNNRYSLGDLVRITETDKDGNKLEYFLFGTNDSDVKGIYTEPNDNFTIQLSKLLNVKGEEWKSTTTAWEELVSGQGPTFAKYAYTVSVNTDAADFKFIIEVGDKKIECEVPEDKRKNSADILAYVAKELNKSGKYPDYKVSASGDQLIFTAKEAGPVATDTGGKPLEPPPGFDINPPFGTWINLARPDNGAENPAFVNGTLPDDAGYFETDEHGNVIKSINYALAQGKWYKITVGATYSHEVTLDDNDLHGILQAQREMLTEEGEFASEKDVAIDESALTKRGLPYYMKSLDLLAQKFAQAYNQLNSGYAYNQDGNYIKENGEELTLPCPVYDENGNIKTGDDGKEIFETTLISADGLTDNQLRYLISKGYFQTNDLGQPIDENGNLILNEDGEPLGYFLTNGLGEPVDKKGNVIRDKNGDFVPVATVDNLSDADHGKLLVDMERFMKDTYGIERTGGELFTQLDGTTTTGINAKNISISYGWGNGVYGLIPTFMMLFEDGEGGGLTHSTQNDNADHMVAMIDKALTYNPRDLYGSDSIGPELFNGSFNDMLSNMMAKEGEDADMTNVRLVTSAGIMEEVDYSRDGVSGVDLNDEAMNMITYQKAMSAAMRVMTVIDEMLDRLINNTAM